MIEGKSEHVRVCGVGRWGCLHCQYMVLENISQNY